jgi:hypothetical protein
MALIANIDYTILNTSTLTPLPFVGEVYTYDFDAVCVGMSADTSLTLCNLTSSAQTYNWVGLGDCPDFICEFLSGLTLNAYETHTFTVNFIPSSVGLFSCVGLDPYAPWENGLELIGYGVNSLLDYANGSCFLDFGNVGLTNTVTASKEIINVTNHNMLISFSGNLLNFGVTSPVLLYPGPNSIDFTFNPQTLGICSEVLLINTLCSPQYITLCGRSVIGNGVVLSMEDTSSYVGCCSTTSLTIFNNLFYSNQALINVTNINYPNSLEKGACAIVNFDFCPVVSGITSTNINVEYTYQYSGTTFTGNSEVEIILSAFTHPFSTMDVTCVPFNCIDVNLETTINITNAGNTDFQFYYFFIPNNDYDFYNIFTTTPEPPCIVPPFSTTGITLDFDASYLTTGSSFSGIFYLKLIDPNCCKEFIKCVNVHFCPTTVTTNFGYPVNVLCHGNCNGQYAFTVNDCSGDYHITWSADTTIPLATEVHSCRILMENGSCFIGEQATDTMPQYYDEISANTLRAGNYLITITNACSATTYHSFTITEPEALFLEINWVNPTNYCRDNISGLCGIVDSPDINPSGYVVLDKETLIKVINNDFHNIVGQEKRGYQQYDQRENQVAFGQQVDSVNSFRNYVLNFFAGSFIKYKRKWEKEEKLTVKAWDEIVSETIGHGCCFSSYVSGGTAPYTYQWFGPNGYTALSPNIFERPCCEPYTLVVTDAHGCTISATSTCLQCTFGIETLTQVNPTCNYSNDGEIYVAVSGNCPDAVYKITLESSSWIDSHTASTYNFTNLVKGDYVLQIENIETECKLNPTNISLLPKYEFNVSTNITGTTCPQYCNGVLEVMVNVTRNEDQIDPEFLFTLDGQYQTSNLFTGICTGNHTLSVLNTLNYCQTTQQITIPNLNLFNIVTTVVPATGPRIPNGQITMTVVNGVSVCEGSEAYQLEDLNLIFDDITNTLLYDEDISCMIEDEEGNCLIDAEDNGPACLECHGLTQFHNHSHTISNLMPGVYYFAITDANGCSKKFKVNVGYSQIKKPKVPHFDSKRTDTYSGSKVTGNTPKGQ